MHCALIPVQSKQEKCQQTVLRSKRPLRGMHALMYFVIDISSPTPCANDISIPSQANNYYRTKTRHRHTPSSISGACHVQPKYRNWALACSSPAPWLPRQRRTTLVRLASSCSAHIARCCTVRPACTYEFSTCLSSAFHLLSRGLLPYS